MSDELAAAARRALEAAVSAGATDAEAWANEGVSRQVQVYDGEVESLSDAGGRGVGVRAFAGERSGYAYGTDLSEEGVTAIARAAVEAAAVADPDEHGGLPDECGATEVEGLASPELASWSTERKVELALEVERAARAREGVTQVENAVYSDAEATVAIANSRGFTAGYSSTDAWAYASAFAGEGSDLMTGLGVGMGRDPGRSTPRRSAARRPSARSRSWAPASPRAAAARSCSTPSWRPRSWASSAGCCPRTRCSAGARCSPTARATRWPTRRSPSPTTPPTRRAPASAPFDGEGSATRRTALIEDGLLKTFLFDAHRAQGRPRYDGERRARLLPLASVGGHVEPDRRRRRGDARGAGGGRRRRPLRDRRRRLHSGVNPVSGTFSVGASGRLIEGASSGARCAS